MRRTMAVVLGLGLALTVGEQGWCDGPMAPVEVETGSTGEGVAIDNMQPGLNLNYFIPLSGVYPSDSSTAVTSELLGTVRMFAGSFTPGGSVPADGRLLPIGSNLALFSLLGTTYGGDGETNFAVPDLTGRVPVHPGTGPGLSRWVLGQKRGVADVTLSEANLPSHSHTLPLGISGTTGLTGGGDPYTNIQPSLGINHIVALTGAFPSVTEGDSVEPFVGQVSMFAGNFAPRGWAFADGGDLPDLRGRAAVHPGTGPGLSSWGLGERRGVEQVTLTEDTMASHGHTYSEGDTGNTGGSMAVTNIQPSLGLNYMIALTGVYPSEDGGTPGEAIVGEVAMFSGNFAPRGWAFADGQVLAIRDNEALFSLLGTTYGGDGEVTFALPDLRGRTVLGSGSRSDLGRRSGSETTILSTENLAGHTHTYLVPEPGTAVLMLGCIPSVLGLGRGGRRV